MRNFNYQSKATYQQTNTKVFFYRPDIDGLRAIAVLAVVLFHLDYGWIKGGYIGVDVFFVISGFLISRIIVKKIQEDKFSFIEFYKRRFWRIIPVLLLVVFVTLFFGYFLLLSSEYKDLAKSSLASILFIPNLFFWAQTGYFEVQADVTPLLHLWSLGVEEQFYLFFPLFALLLLNKLNEKYVFLILTLVITLSFYLNIIHTQQDITLSFYSLHTRAWELLAGFFITLLLQYQIVIRKLTAELFSLTGLGLIIFSMLNFDKHILFPGFYASIPVIGSMLIIFAGSYKYETITKKILAFKPMVFIGLISYSLYLWHWPISVFFRMFFTSGYVNELIFTVSILVSIFSFKFIEQPFRAKGQFHLNHNFRKLSVSLMAVLTVFFSMTIIYTNGLSYRLPDAVIYASQSKDYLPENRHCHRMKAHDIKEKNFCVFGDTNKTPSFALFGDSHAEALKYGLKLAAIDKERSGIQYTKPGCRPILGIDRKGRKSCLRFTEIALKDILEKPNIDTVFLAGYWALAYKGFNHNHRKFVHHDYYLNTTQTETRGELFLRGLNRTFDQLIKANKRIVLVGDTPVIEFNPRSTYARNIFLNRSQKIVGAVTPNITDIMKQEIHKYDNKIEFMSTSDYLCPQNPCDLVKDSILLFRDDDHITRKASALLAPVFKEYL